MEQPFYIGQEVVALLNCSNRQGYKVIKDHHYIVKDMMQCKCGRWKVDVGMEDRVNEISVCSCRLEYYEGPAVWSNHDIFAPIERAKTKYVVKEVEVSPAIRELETCTN